MSLLLLLLGLTEVSPFSLCGAAPSVEIAKVRITFVPTVTSNSLTWTCSHDETHQRPKTVVCCLLSPQLEELELHSPKQEGELVSCLESCNNILIYFLVTSEASNHNTTIKSETYWLDCSILKEKAKGEKDTEEKSRHKGEKLLMIYTGSIYTPFETLPITVITRVVQRSDKVGQRLALCSFQEMAFLPPS